MPSNRLARHLESIVGATAGIAGVLIVLVVRPPTTWEAVGAAFSALCAVLLGLWSIRAKRPRWLGPVVFLTVLGLFLIWAETYPSAGMIYIFALGAFAALAIGFRSVTPGEDNGSSKP